MSADQMHSNRDIELSNSFYIGSQPITRAQVTGMITAVSKASNRTSIGVDDGTGVITCVYWLNNDDPIFKLGDVIQIIGKLTIFREQIQLTIENYQFVGFNDEILHWLRAVDLMEIYSKPVVIKEQIKAALTEPDDDLRIIRDWIKLQHSFEFHQLLQDNSWGMSVATKRKHVKTLQEEGFIYLSNEERDEFTMVDASNLGRDIIEIVQRETMKSGSIGFDLIRYYLKPEFKNAGFKQMNRILDELVRSDQITQISQNKYKAF
ncbi:hypothetical protein HDV04_003296 [Boothiomyces sp. JEL0838]|nr:hypothetical protein HDV04_003274 [Boothiomyces sp. JEL0838]KAJ3312275.1 hypothetical protein HDV04_003296 [Boothiomyces sp. JEL0838]